jgi:glycerophosphoryl diester phosphodiesterase
MVFFISAFSGCIPEPESPTPNVDLDFCIKDPACPFKLSVAHRGTYLYAPENTIAAFYVAYKTGVDCIELDVRNTADQELVLMHDETVDRTTNGHGRVDEMTLEQIKSLIITNLFPYIPPQKVPTFREALDFCRGKLVIDVDVKTDLLESMVEEIADAGMLDQVMVLTKSIAAGRIMKSVVPEIALLGRPDSVDEVYEYLSELEMVAVEVDYPVLMQTEQAIHGAGLKTLVDATGYFDLLGKTGYNLLIKGGADIIETDNIAVVVPYLRELNGWNLNAEGGAQD